MKYCNRDVVRMFLNKKEACGHSNNLRSVGCGSSLKLFSYSTCMAEWIDGKLYINTSKYSRTTSKQMAGMPNERYHAGYNCVFVDTGTKYGLSSVYGYWLDHEGKKKKMRMQKFNEFRESIKDFIAMYSYGLSNDTINFINSLHDDARANNWKKYQSKFVKIRDSRMRYSSHMTESFARRGNERLFENKQKAFAF